MPDQHASVQTFCTKSGSGILSEPSEPSDPAIVAGTDLSVSTVDKEIKSIYDNPTTVSGDGVNLCQSIRPQESDTTAVPSVSLYDIPDTVSDQKDNLCITVTVLPDQGDTGLTTKIFVVEHSQVLFSRRSFNQWIGSIESD